MTLREIVYKIKADKLHIQDYLTGETVTVDYIKPDSLRVVQRFLHCEIMSVEPKGDDVKVVVV